jgi:hypothetical protein
MVLSQPCIGSRIYIPIDSIIKKCPLIIEGKIISTTPAYKSGGMIYTSYIVQVYKVFRGSLTTKFIELPMEGGWVGNVGVSIPSCGTVSLVGAGIFFLSNPADSVSKMKYLNSGDTIAKNFIVYPYYDGLGYDNFPNIERDLYQHIEKLTGLKRRIISHPEVEDIDTRNWLIQNHKVNLLESNGLTINLVHAELGNGQKTFDLFIDAKSTNLFCDLNSLEFAVKYNPKTFGTWVVKNRNVEFNSSKIYPVWKWENISNILLSDSAYKTHITDLDSSTILISINAIDTSKGIFQISKALVAYLHFKIKDFNSSIGFSLVNEKANGKFYNYEDSKISSFKYIFCNKGIDISTNSFITPVVKDFSPDTILCGQSEILIIKGQHFLSDKTQVLLWCTKDDCGFNEVIPSSKFISQTDTTISLNIPCTMDVGVRFCGTVFQTTSGFIVNKEGMRGDSYSPRKLYIKHPDKKD